ncbi:hypothetical protein PMI01_00461 [Caulobacter sp. AP07]|uniref:hypothetical protein n=1 Tax=Caulobacter sp. AP07 TaxID=1144304 RepID=UPI00027224D1|nr:hypothetical protein [Caulobacter sp. AP07]EJL37873.1 hypothetical protein PMI01_00461 [Caulobacter sp. AP07]
MTKAQITPWLALPLCLALALAACGPRAGEAKTDVAAKTSVAKPKRCPDPDVRDSSDPCSVAYVQRKPGRMSERDLH